MLLKEVSAQEPSAPSWQALQERWAALQAGGSSTAEDGSGDESGETGALLLLVISHAAANFPRGQADELAAQLLRAILTFDLPAASASAHITALFKLSKAQEGGSSGGDMPPEQWCKDVYTAAHRVLSRCDQGVWGGGGYRALSEWI